MTDHPSKVPACEMTKGMLSLVLVLHGLVLATGCKSARSEFTCASMEQCVDGARIGICVQSGGAGHCAFPDSQCALGYRYDKTAAALANLCIGPSSSTDDMGAADDMATPPDMAVTCQPACSGTTPICEVATTAACRACGSNTECATATGSAQPVCSLSSGACVGCAGNSDCSAAKPICNVANGSCGPCTQHNQCPASGVCFQGTCLDVAKVVYVTASGSGCPAGPGSGTMVAPYCTVQKGFDIAAAQNKYVAVLAGTYTPAAGGVLTVNNPTADYVVKGIGIGNPTLSVSAMQGSVVTITNTTANHVNVQLDGFTIRGGSGDGQGGGPGSGVDILGGGNKALTQVSVTNSTITRNDFQGVSAVNATLILDGDTLSQNSFQNVLANNGIVTITNTTARESGYISGTSYSSIDGIAMVGSSLTMDKVIIGPKNGGSGLSLSQSTFTVTNTVVHRNGQSGFTSAAIEITAAAQPNQTLFNVTVADNVGTIPGIRCSSTQPIVANTVVFNNAIPNQATITSCAPTNSAFFGGGSPNQDLNNCTDKVFVNASTTNYLPLKGGAPPCSLVGQGVDSVVPSGGTAVTTNHDVVGTARKTGMFDIGGYQSN